MYPAVKHTNNRGVRCLNYMTAHNRAGPCPVKVPKRMPPADLDRNSTEILLVCHFWLRQPFQAMHSVKISPKIDEATWNELKALAAETHLNVSGLLTEAIQEYVAIKRVRPAVLKHLDQSSGEHEALGRLFAKE